MGNCTSTEARFDSVLKKLIGAEAQCRNFIDVYRDFCIVQGYWDTGVDTTTRQELQFAAMELSHGAIFADAAAGKLDMARSLGITHQYFYCVYCFAQDFYAVIVRHADNLAAGTAVYTPYSAADKSDALAQMLQAGSTMQRMVSNYTSMYPDRISKFNAGLVLLPVSHAWPQDASIYDTDNAVHAASG